MVQLDEKKDTKSAEGIPAVEEQRLQMSSDSPHDNYYISTKPQPPNLCFKINLYPITQLDREFIEEII